MTELAGDWGPFSGLERRKGKLPLPHELPAVLRNAVEVTEVEPEAVKQPPEVPPTPRTAWLD